MGHIVYRSIVGAVRAGRLVEPFSNSQFKDACPGLGEGTYNAFLNKHREGNPGGNSELFSKPKPGRFQLIRPIRYDI